VVESRNVEIDRSLLAARNRGPYIGHDIVGNERTAALAYWQGQYVAIDQNEDAVRLAEVSLPAPRSRRES
jgi:hypothetical protein